MTSRNSRKEAYLFAMCCPGQTLQKKSPVNFVGLQSGYMTYRRPNPKLKDLRRMPVEEVLQAAFKACVAGSFPQAGVHSSCPISRYGYGKYCI